MFASVSLCRSFAFSLLVLFGFVLVRPKFQTYGVRHMLPYLYLYYLCLSSIVVSYELHAYPVLYPTLIYPVLELLDYKI